MSGILDAHQHIWNRSRAAYDWLGPDAGPIFRDFDLPEALAVLDDAGVDGTILVQSADNDEDTEFMLEAARASARVRGVVAWVPLDEPARAAERLAELRADPIVCGIRSLIHTRDDPHWLLRPDVDAGLGLLEDAGVPFDVVAVLPEHLEAVLVVSERHPGLRMVIDHLGKPPLGGGGGGGGQGGGQGGGPHDRHDWDWHGLIAEVAANPLVFGKVSGLYPPGGLAGAAGPAASDALRPVFDCAVEVFGPDRLMYGGDWPISLLAGGYRAVLASLTPLLDGLDPRDRERILSGTARDFYRTEHP
ncbi:metal-dependent hydrolase [Agromyces tardus]|uniref:Metal-dependent hydrolase n=1 Tax=Agromyces tardus TaxID=2583849 RepID=A0A3M8AJL9_9MICO|nr:amidohydrolase family protein [Agromyces tardus]RNB50665.1 metal-dependent hydrolase [Agromyces tardus]